MPHRFPQEAVLRDGRRVLLRPFARKDVNALYDFFQRLPESSRRFAWDRVDDRATVERWGVELDYEKVFPLLALHGAKIVADATLHRRQQGPLRLTGRVKWSIDPEYRGVGLLSLGAGIGASARGIEFDADLVGSGGVMFRPGIAVVGLAAVQIMPSSTGVTQRYSLGGGVRFGRHLA